MGVCAVAIKAERTKFSLDVLGRYTCNTWQEAKDSIDQTSRPDARQFDVVIVGGGTFGAALAQHIFSIDTSHSHRILVLEAGPFLVPEHTQNLPMLGLDAASPTSIAALRAAGQDGQPRKEVWGLAWHSPVDFQGLAYCVGGRSLYWGGWSPQLLAEEMPIGGVPGTAWPKPVVDDLTSGGYFAQSNAQIGSDDSNYYIFGSLQSELRKILAAGLSGGKVSDAITPSLLPDHPGVAVMNAPTAAQLDQMLGFDAPSGLPVAELKDLMKLEAPLAVQVRSRSGLFPLNKFSSTPLLIKAARVAENETPQDDVKKRLMVVDNCHVTALGFDGSRVHRVDTNFGPLPLPANGVVILAAATIESTRLALNSFHGSPNYGLIGQNLVAHLRSNLNVRIPIANIPGLAGNLEQAVLFVKGRHKFADGSFGHYHLQIKCGWPDQVGKHKTGAIYNEDAQTLTQQAALPAGQWNQFEITAKAQHYTVHLNGAQVAVFDNATATRGLPTPAFIGLQSHPASIPKVPNTGRVAFRRIQIKQL